MNYRTQLSGLAAAVAILTASLGFAQDEAPGVVRISDMPAVGSQMKAQARHAGKMMSYAKSEDCVEAGGQTGDCRDGECEDCQECRGIPCLPCLLGLPCFFHHSKCKDDPQYNPHAGHFDPYATDCYYDKHGKLICDKPYGFKRFRKKAACRYGYFHPQGYCGKGLALAGSYKHVYSLNPDYFDPRDGRLYAAQGYGTNISVPLAPTVGSVYNYGWGIPSSRQTYVSHRIPLPVKPLEPTPEPQNAPLPAVD